MGLIKLYQHMPRVSVTVIVVALSVILSVVLVTVFKSEPVQERESITFDEFVNRKFKSAERNFNGTWYNDDDHNIVWTDSETGDLRLFNVKTLKTKSLVSKSVLDRIGSDRPIHFLPSSSSRDCLLFYHDETRVYRHSFLAEYSVYQQSTQKIIRLKENEKLQYVTWIPNTEDSIVFVYRNDVYYQRSVTDPESAERITSDGIVGIVYNGIPDWVYEEEILGCNHALYLNQVGSRLAFVRFDDTDVPQFYYSRYGSLTSNQYPENVMIRYPKVGAPNPKVRVLVRHLQDRRTFQVEPPQEISELSDFLIVGLSWMTDQTLNVVWTNRIQTRALITECQIDSDTKYVCHVIDDQRQEHGWIDIFHQPKFLSTEKASFLHIRPESTSGFNHIARITYKPEKNIEWLTEGSYSVVEILDWRNLENDVYFLGTKPDFPGMRHLYKIEGNGTINCLTCSLKSCQYVSVTFDGSGGNYYVRTCSNPVLVPIVTLHQRGTDRLLFTLESNDALKDLLKIKALPERWDLSIPISTTDAAGSMNAPVMMLLPPKFDSSRKYPTLVFVYGGPGSQEVSYQWSSPGWRDYLVSLREIVYVIIDGRGTGFQSTEYQFSNYLRLGTLEIQDQISVTRTLQQKYTFLDSSRTGIWGWSYGGYATLMTLINDVDNVFSCGVAVAPPTNWLLYDSMYTERFMGLKDENADGYARSSILGKADHLRNKTFMLNHGSADDNVHYQHTMLLMKELEHKNIDFEEHTYPDESHGLEGVPAFLYHQMDKFWSKCFRL